VLSTRALLKLHRYAGLITAPLILFFAISGIWQVFRLHEDTKGGYQAPQALKAASDFHKAENLNGKPAAVPFQIAVSLCAAVLVFGAILGIIAAFRLTRPAWLAALILLIGAAVPYVLYLIATMKQGSG
jgi:hypothetical protein